MPGQKSGSGKLLHSLANRRLHPSTGHQTGDHYEALRRFLLPAENTGRRRPYPGARAYPSCFQSCPAPGIYFDHSQCEICGVFPCISV